MKKLTPLLLAGLLALSGCADAFNDGSRQNSPYYLDSSTTAKNKSGTLAVDIGDEYALGQQEGLGHAVLLERMDGDVIEINEKVFIAQTNDIYLNAEDYLGKTIKYEGIFFKEVWEAEEADGEDEIFYSVIRYGPGCCGNDGNAGFEVVWDGDWPEEDDWVEAVGVLDFYEYGGWRFLCLRLDSLTVLDERGLETVAQ